MDEVILKYYKSVFWKDELRDWCIGFSKYSVKCFSLEDIQLALVKKELESNFDYVDIIKNGEYVGSLGNDYTEIIKQWINHNLSVRKVSNKYAFVNNPPELLFNIGHVAQLSPWYVIQGARFNLNGIKNELKNAKNFKVLFSACRVVDKIGVDELLDYQNILFVSWDGAYLRVGFDYVDVDKPLISIVRDNWDILLDNLLNWINNVEEHWKSCFIDRLIELYDNLINKELKIGVISSLHNLIVELYFTLSKYVTHFGIKKFSNSNRTTLEINNNVLYYIKGRKKMVVLREFSNGEFCYEFWKSLNNISNIADFIKDCIDILLMYDIEPIIQNGNPNEKKRDAIQTISDRTFLNKKLDLNKIPESIFIPELDIGDRDTDAVDALLLTRCDLECGDIWVNWNENKSLSQTLPLNVFFDKITINIEAMDNKEFDFYTLYSLAMALDKEELLKIKIEYNTLNENFPLHKVMGLNNILSLTLENNTLTVKLRTYNPKYPISQSKQDAITLMNELKNKYEIMVYITKILNTTDILNNVNNHISKCGLTNELLKDLLDGLIKAGYCIAKNNNLDEHNTLKLDKNTTLILKNKELQCEIQNKTFKIFQLDENGDITQYYLFASYRSLTNGISTLNLLFNRCAKTILSDETY